MLCSLICQCIYYKEAARHSENENMENAATTGVGIPRTNNVKSGAIHKPRKFKIAKMWGLFINRENSNFAKFKTAKLKK